MTAMVIIPIARLLRREQHFRCERLSCTLSAGARVDRQRRSQTASHTAGRGPSPYGASESDLAARVAVCRDCAEGRQVLDALGVGQHAPRAPRAPVPAVTTCPVPGCVAGRGRLHGRTPPAYVPLCTLHRRYAAHVRSVRGVTHEEAFALITRAREV